MFSILLCCIVIMDIETNLWGQAVGDGGVDAVAVSGLGHKAVRVPGEAVTSRGQAVRRASVLGASCRAEPTLVHGGGGQRLRSVDCTGLLGCCTE